MWSSALRSLSCLLPPRLSTITDLRLHSQLRPPLKIKRPTSLHQRKPFVVSSSLGSPTLSTSAAAHHHILALKLIASAGSSSSSFGSLFEFNFLPAIKTIDFISSLFSIPQAALSAAWLLLSVIPAILALRKASESLANQFDAAREKLPDAMADMRLAGVHISDLTMELSDLGQEITDKVKNSTHAVRVAEEIMRQFATLSATGAKDGAVFSSKSDVNDPPLAKSVRGIKEGIVTFRSSLQMFSTFIHYFKLTRNFIAARVQAQNR